MTWIIRVLYLRSAEMQSQRCVRSGSDPLASEDEVELGKICKSEAELRGDVDQSRNTQCVVRVVSTPELSGCMRGGWDSPT